MHIIAIGWLWVALMMSITQTSILRGVSTFVFYGVLPCALLLYLLGTPARRRRQARRAAASQTPPPQTPQTPRETTPGRD